MLVATALLTAGGLGLSACGGSGGQALAQQACVHVHRSLADYHQSTKPGVPAATVAKLQQQAGNELQVALPLAAQANSADGTWNSLMTVISESATIDEGHLRSPSRRNAPPPTPTRT